MLSSALLLLAITSLTSANPILDSRAAAATRCSTSDPCFPNAATLSAFNSTIGGRLYAERPVERVCYASDPDFNAAACASYTAQMRSDAYVSSNFATYEQSNWETCGVSDSCLWPSTTNKVCGQGSIPQYAVHAQTADDVQKYVQFATKNNLKIVVKNTGHDYKGRSSGKGGFALWTHGLQELTHKASFVPKGCKIAAQDAITIGAGVQWGDAYKFADSVGKLLVGGDNGYVGAGGGWVQGGGHSFNTPVYGMGVDNLLEMDIVTADGQLQTISECSNPDLFFAVRGGGGGTWGVATRVTYKAHDSVPIQSALSLTTGLSLTGDAIQQILTSLAKIQPALADLGMGGVAFIGPSEAFFLLTLPQGANVSKTALQDGLKPFFGNPLGLGLSGSGLSTSLSLKPAVYQTYGSFYELYLSTIATVNEPVGIPITISSRLIPRKYFETDPAGVASALRRGQSKLTQAQQIANPVQILITGSIKNDNSKNVALNKAWYSSIWHVIYTGTFDVDGSQADQASITQNVHDAAQVLRDYAPDGCAYQNEADVYEPNHQTTFWGTNYARLLSIKKKVDPSNFFSVWQGVGWQGPDDSKFQCYKANTVPGVDLQ